MLAVRSVAGLRSVAHDCEKFFTVLCECARDHRQFGEATIAPRRDVMLATLRRFVLKDLALVTHADIEDAGFVWERTVRKRDYRFGALITVRLTLALGQMIFGVRQALKDFFVKVHTISSMQ